MRIVEDTLSSRPDRALRRASADGAVPGARLGGLGGARGRQPGRQRGQVLAGRRAGRRRHLVEGDEVLVAVTDRGPGIAADAQERIFERFERLEETRKQTGTGLGLYITRRLARAMGGDVTVSSVPGAGSTFLLRLPSAPVDADVEKPDARAADDRAARRQRRTPALVPSPTLLGERHSESDFRGVVGRNLCSFPSKVVMGQAVRRRRPRSSARRTLATTRSGVRQTCSHVQRTTSRSSPRGRARVFLPSPGHLVSSYLISPSASPTTPSSPNRSRSGSRHRKRRPGHCSSGTGRS